MLTVDYIKSVAFELAEHNDSRTASVVKDLIELADQLEYLEERDTITDSRISFLKEISDNCKEEVKVLQGNILQLQQDNLELRKQVAMLKQALVT
jgi:hypothetical protein